MNKFNFFKTFVTVLFISTSAFFISCSNDDDSHEHTFATEWTYDATHHWHAATCEHKDQIKDKAEHTFGEWKSNKDATTEADGTKTRICSVCGYAETVTDKGSKIGSVAIPTFSLASGVVDKGTSVTITSTTEGAKIYYTTDGTDPTASSTEYISAINITAAVTIKAIAVKDGMSNSAVESANYTISTVATPAFSVASSEVECGTCVTISCGTQGAKIYYTTDGSEPTASNTQYTTAVSITAAVTIKAIAVKDGMNDSTVESVSYTVIPEGFVKVSGGTVTGATYTDKYEGVFPAGRKVTLSSFYMGKYEVTQAQYKAVMEGQKVTAGGTEYVLADSPSYCVQGSTYYLVDSDKDHANFPVEGVTWYDSVYYCNALSKKEKLDPCYTISVTTVNSSGHITAATVDYDKTKNGYRLPTEAEWEYAARGGDPSKVDWNYTYSGSNKAEDTSYYDEKNTGLDNVGWYYYNNITGTTGDSSETISATRWGTHEVGKKKANALGIYDMSGNVWEWCYDWFGDIVAEEITDPVGAFSGNYRILRGGSWYHGAGLATVSRRYGFLLHPQFDPKALNASLPLAEGLNVSPGAGWGAIVFTAEEAVEWNKAGKRIMLVCKETSPDDIAGMYVAQGILTSTGDRTSHAAVVARGLGTPCVCGCDEVVFLDKETVKIGGKTFKKGDIISIDGSTGKVYGEKLPVTPVSVSGDLASVSQHCEFYPNLRDDNHGFRVCRNAN